MINYRSLMMFMYVVIYLGSLKAVGQTSIGGIGTYNKSGFGIGFQVVIKENNKISYQTRLVDNWGNKNKLAYQSYELGAGIRYRLFEIDEDMSILIGGAPTLAFQRKSDEDSNTLQQFNYGGNGSFTLNISAANNSIIGITVSKAAYAKQFVAAKDLRIGLTYSFY